MKINHVSIIINYSVFDKFMICYLAPCQHSTYVIHSYMNQTISGFNQH